MTTREKVFRFCNSVASLWRVGGVNSLQHGGSMTDYPEIEVCTQCGENTVFEQDEYGEWLSVCCSARAVNLDEDYDLGYLEVDDPAFVDDPEIEDTDPFLEDLK